MVVQRPIEGDTLSRISRPLHRDQRPGERKFDSARSTVGDEMCATHSSG
jgi:hypothetical protein